MAVTTSLSDALWQSTGVCRDASFASGDAVEVMTPDARAYQMSIELRALQELLRTQQREDLEHIAASFTSSEDAAAHTFAPRPCAAPRGDESAEGREAIAACIAREETSGDQPARVELHEFVAISLLEDIAPLDPSPSNPNSCQTSSSGPDRCESHPPFPPRLHLDVTFGSALLPSSGALLAATGRKTTHTLPLEKVHTRRLLEPASGHTRDEERPPEA